MKKLLASLATILVLGAGCATSVNTTPGPDANDYQNSICVNQCGNGSCEEIVCQGTGCPCAESQTTCPNDCGSPAAADMSDLIQVNYPTDNALVTSPLTVTGQARGSWFFEAQFPVSILDANNAVLGTATAHATGDWMTEDFVPFTATITFNLPSTTTGTLFLQNDNPSGLPANAKSLSIPITF